MKQKILVADDEECIRFTFSDFLQGAGFHVETAGSLTNCINRMQQEPFDLLFLDIGFGTENGIEAIQALKTLQPKCRIVIITGSPRQKSLVQAKRYGAIDYLVKPVHQVSLIYNTKRVLAR